MDLLLPVSIKGVRTGGLRLCSLENNMLIVTARVTSGSDLRKGIVLIWAVIIQEEHYAECLKSMSLPSWLFH